ncbi:leucine-rich repeat-containing protein 51 isoform X2 [Aethina tumida]|uniref:leucine-rich repeat-containing protein 51 isoform X2 n=1 Tax=Aethina tumida TaxID=116153 RepID=UPI00096B0AD2|nr:leucine-rich repeat-containing protein 51 isoform X2 [Aethina tumida]
MELDPNDEKILFESLPLDLTFRNYRRIEDVGVEGVRSTRVLGTPKKAENDKYLTRSIWLNNNRIKSLGGFDVLIDALLVHPQQLMWVDLSFNYIRTIDEVLLKFPKLKILYLHGNCITDLDEIFKLRELKELRTITLQGNPISNLPKYRNYVISSLPQIFNLDFTPVLKTDKMMPLLPEVIKKIEQSKKQQAKAAKEAK